jgi:hypothetical protein
MAVSELLDITEEELELRVMTLRSRIEYAKIDDKISPELVDSWRQDMSKWAALQIELQTWRQQLAN